MSKQTYSKRKGQVAEADVVAFLRSLGIEAERRRLAGAGDLGDVSGFRSVCIEVKSCKRHDPAGWLDECAVETANCAREFGTEHVGFVIAKRRGKSDVKDWFAIMSPELAVAAVRALLRERQQEGAR